jgi:hypothetical protein
VLMSPPFGTGGLAYTSTLEKRGKEGGDLAAAFTSQALALTVQRGYVGVLTTRWIFFLEGFAAWRRSLLLSQHRLKYALDLGYGVLDVAIEVCAASMQHGSETGLACIVDAFRRHEDLDRHGSDLLHELPLRTAWPDQVE